MTTAVQRRRGTTAQHASFTGLVGEITVDTDKKTAVVHDGSTAGGNPLAKEAALTAHTTASTGVHGLSGAVVGTSDAQTLDNKTLTNPVCSLNAYVTSAVGNPKLVRYGHSTAAARFFAGVSGEAELGSNSGSDYLIQSYSDTGTFIGQPLFFRRATGYCYMTGVYAATTASGANVTVGSDGLLMRSTSREEYKTDIEPVEVSYADKILDLQAIWYHSASDADPAEWSYYSFGAEAVAAIDPRLVFWGRPIIGSQVVREATEDTPEITEPVYGELRPEGINDRAMIALLQDVVKRLAARVEALEEKVGAS